MGLFGKEQAEKNADSLSLQPHFGLKMLWKVLRGRISRTPDSFPVRHFHATLILHRNFEFINYWLKAEIMKEKAEKKPWSYAEIGY